MPSELLNALFKRRSDVDSSGQVWESKPEESSADAGALHLAGLTFDGPSAQEWLKQLEPSPEEDLLAEAINEGPLTQHSARCLAGEFCQDKVDGCINIAVVGNSGVGKSLLINRLRRLRTQAEGWAPVGVNETTREPTMYPYPNQPSVRLWDLPGAGTAAVPAESYLQEKSGKNLD
eukprot:g252.t1